jgi:tRNA modification GTPase
VTLLDTAGVRESDDPVEQEGVRRARARAEAADLVLWVQEAGEVGGDAERTESNKQWKVHNKVDLLDPSTKQAVQSRPAFQISALAGEGVDRLLAALANYAADYLKIGEPALVTRQRHRDALHETAAALGRVLRAPPGQEELIAEELRLATRALGRLTGRVDVEDILDVIFRDFCIGK